MINTAIIEGLQEIMHKKYYAFVFSFQCGHAVKGVLEYQLYHDFLHEWYKKQFKDFHKVVDYLAGNNCPVVVPPLNTPTLSNPEEILHEMYRIHGEILSRLGELAKMCEEMGNVSMANFFQEFSQEEEQLIHELTKRCGVEPPIS